MGVSSRVSLFCHESMPQQDGNAPYIEAIVGPADFIIYAEDHELALQALQSYCADVPSLHLSPDFALFYTPDVGDTARPVNEIANYQPVKLLRYRENRSIESAGTNTHLPIEVPGQLELFNANEHMPVIPGVRIHFDS